MWLDFKSSWMNAAEMVDKFAPLRPLVLANWGHDNQGEHIPQDKHGRGEICNFTLYSCPGHPIWDFVITALEKEIAQELKQKCVPQYGARFGKQAVLELTGPIMIKSWPWGSEYITDMVVEPHIHGLSWT